MGSSSQKPKYLKIMLYLKKRDDVSDEKFHSHWRTKHVDLAFENKTFMSKTRRYVQLHNSPELKAEAATFGIPVLDFDGIAEVWVDSIEDWKKIVGDAEFVKHIAADEANFIQPPITVMLGRDEPMIEDGKIVQEGRN